MFREVFFTGFPGFIGSKLVRRLLAEGATVHCLVQPHTLPQAQRERDELGTDSTRLQLYTGDITQQSLGLDAEIYRDLTAKISHVFHLAAVYDLAVPRQLAELVNVTGTDNVNRFCLDCSVLERYIYYSTCYVSGDYTGVFTGQDLEKGQGFKNHYESTKHTAEVHVRKFLDQVPTTIIRPAIVVGDSRTGEINKFDGPYFIMAFARRFARLPLPYVGKGKAPLNLVPVDYLVDGTMALAASNQTVGGTFQVADPSPYTAREVYREIVRLVAGKEPSWQLPLGLAAGMHRLGLVRRLTGLERETFVYMDHMVRYDTSSTDVLLQQAGVTCPDLMAILPTLVEFFLDNTDKREYYKPARTRVVKP